MFYKFRDIFRRKLLSLVIYVSDIRWVYCISNGIQLGAVFGTGRNEGVGHEIVKYNVEVFAINSFIARRV